MQPWYDSAFEALEHWVDDDISPATSADGLEVPRL
jgi:hypothetical protein